MGGKPKTSTPKDKRLTENQPAAGDKMPMTPKDMPKKMPPKKMR